MSQQISASETRSNSTSTRRGARFRWFPIASVVTAAVGVAVIWALPEDSLDRQLRLFISMLIGAFTLLELAVWFLLFSGLPGVVRGGALVVGVVLLAGWAASVRRVEFSGDMIPTFEMRWSPTREAALESHRATVGEVEGPLGGLAAPEPEDVLEYRGARRDGVITGPALARSWNAQSPKVVWKQPVGGGYASLVVLGDLAITIEQRGENEAVVAYDVSSGRERWIHQYPALFSEKLGGDGPRATPTLHEGRVYSLGATGILKCLDARDGKPIWDVNIFDVDGSQNIDWGMSGSPLVYRGLVIVNPGAQKGTEKSGNLAAFDAATGELRWVGGKAKAAYTSPMVANLVGTEQVLSFDAGGVAGYDPADGSELWRFAWPTQFDNQAAQPIVLPDDQLLISSGAGAALVKVSHGDDGTWHADEVWHNNRLKCSFACPIAVGDAVYGLDMGILTCLNWRTGERLWKGGRYGHGQMLLAGDLLLVLSEAGELVLVEATPDEPRELAKLQAIEGKTWNNPVLVRGKAIVRNHVEMACLELPLADGAGSVDEKPAEETADDTVPEEKAGENPGSQ